MFAKDIDGDNSVEIVEFQGIYGDGQIQVLQFVDLSFIQDIYPFGFNPSFDDASNTDLHLIDINGDGYDDIYISLGRDSPKYIMEYDTATLAYETPTEILDGELVPAGDLNDDGKHDFIMGDPNNDFAPYIAYGSEDLPANISLDVQLEGDHGAKWSWEMQYNPYSGFGDLDGDGIDDVLLSHTEYSENSVKYGRRIVFGSEGLSSDNSEFHLYPREYFYNLIYEVEELGDVNDDGVDDFAIVLRNQGKVEIFYGGSSISQSPDDSFSSGYYLSSITKGDFTGDGINDIVTISDGLNGRLIEVFEGGSSFTKIKSIDFSDFQDTDRTTVYGVNNIGDSNGNGSSDFLIGSGSAADFADGYDYLNEAYIFHGGSSISSTPNDILEYTDIDSISINVAESATALGDLDDDGLGDFAVGAPLKNGSEGEVSVYLSNSNESIRLRTSEGYFFGTDIVSGDFNGDGLKDLAVSVAYSETIAEIYYGREDFDTTPDQSLTLPDFYSEEFNFMVPSLETIPDFDADSRDDLIVGSTGYFNKHAVLYSDIDKTSPRTSLIKGANANAGLGGTNFLNKYGTMASGDFTDNGMLDVIISQYNDNSDGIFTSRVYRYELTPPVNISSVEDVPNDQGYNVQLNLDGYLFDAAEEGISSFDSLWIKRRPAGEDWNDTTTVSFQDFSRSIVYEVPKTQPTNAQEIDQSYIFQIEIFDGENGLIAKSDTAKGRAFDNIAPEVVQGVEITEENDSKVISWQESGAEDLESYRIYRIKDNGELSDETLEVADTTKHKLPDTFSGVQNFVLRARDIHNNIGEPSMPATAVYPKKVTYNINSGWNIVALALEDNTGQPELQELASGTFYKYDGGYQEVEQLEAGQAYWAKFSAAANPEFEGMPITEKSIELREGWNLIGGIGGDLPVSSIDDSGEIIIPETIYSFDQSYTSVETLGPAEGYWIRTSAEGTVTLTHPKLLEQQSEGVDGAEKSLAKAGGDVTKPFNKITISDNRHSAELYFGQKLPKNIDKRRYSLPPLPPGNVFDARFDGDRRLVENDKVDILLNTIEEQPLKIRIDAGSGAEENQFIIKEFSNGTLLAKHTVNDSEEIRLKHNNTDSITLTPVGVSQLAQQEAPDEFGLEQNYPNPFNPTTQIQYSVAEATNIKIDVFNILGRRITTLVNERQKPGTYEVTFDGSNFASGIYLYRLQAGDYISTKKFILAK